MEPAVTTTTDSVTTTVAATPAPEVTPPASTPSTPATTPSPKKGKGMFLAIGLVLFLVLLGISASLVYFGFIIPSQAKEFATKTKSSFDSVQSSLSKIEEDIPDLFGSNSALEDYEGFHGNTTGLASSLNSASKLPVGNSQTDELSTALTKYYANVKAFEGEYFVLTNFLNQTFSILNDITTIFNDPSLTASETGDDLKIAVGELEEDIGAIETRISDLESNISTNEDIKAYQEISLSLLNEFYDIVVEVPPIYTEVADAYDSGSELAFNLALDKLSDKLNELKEIQLSDAELDSVNSLQPDIEDYFQGKLDALKSEGNAIDALFAKFK